MLTNLITFLIPFIFFNRVTGNTTKEPLKDVQMKSTLKFTSEYVPTPETWEANPNLNSLWAYHPSLLTQARKEQESVVHHVSLKAPFAVTRLAKPLTFGVDPYFNKGYFEPFERRQKPVTLVVFRRNGLLLKHAAKVDNSESAEVAEMQSPFNDVSSFWQDEPKYFK